MNNDRTKQLTDIELTSLRACLEDESDTNTLISIDPSLTIIHHLKQGERYGTCHNYAYSKCLGLLGKIPTLFSIIGCQDWYEKYNILEHFTKVDQPRKGDIIIYKKNASDHSICHTGIIENNDFVESKWGQSRLICLHKRLHAPLSYGDYNEYYRQCQPTSEIIKQLHDKINRNPTISAYRLLIKTQLLELSEKAPQTRCLYNQTLHTPNSLMRLFLESEMCCYVDSMNDQYQTLLILATRANNHDTVKVLLKYGANVHLQDNDGNTALDIARQKKYTKIIDLLTKI